jgi:hypothetical protein
MVRPSIAIRRISMTRHEDFSAHRLGPYNGSVKVVNLEPEKQAVPRRHVVRVADASVVMFHFPSVQLHHELAGMDEAFVIRPAMIALAVEQPLIPSAAGLNVSNANQWLWSHIVSLSVVHWIIFHTFMHRLSRYQISR